MNLFWDQGYEGTSFDQLIQAMGISPSSFYNSFGSKEQLYKEATDAYLSLSAVWFAGELFGSADTRQAFRNFLDATVVHANEPPAGVHDFSGRHPLAGRICFDSQDHGRAPRKR
jgi:AcrR family transcriptional regulator